MEQTKYSRHRDPSTLRDLFSRAVWLSLATNIIVSLIIMYRSTTFSAASGSLRAIDAASMWIATYVMVCSVKRSSLRVRRVSISVLIATGVGAVSSTMKCYSAYG